MVAGIPYVGFMVKKSYIAGRKPPRLLHSYDYFKKKGTRGQGLGPLLRLNWRRSEKDKLYGLI
jgi:hypothetical protein